MKLKLPQLLLLTLFFAQALFASDLQDRDLETRLRRLSRDIGLRLRAFDIRIQELEYREGVRRPISRVSRETSNSPVDISRLRCKGTDTGCCTEDEPCDLGDGDCDEDSQCRGDLICGDNNCPAGNDQIDSALLWNAGDDCCMRQA